MNTKYLANHIDTEGKFYPIRFDDPMPTSSDMLFELTMGIAALVAFVCFIIMVSAL